MPSNSDALFSHQAVLLGTAGLLLFWLVLSFIEKRRNRLGALISRAAIKPPLMLGLAAALYLGWLINSWSNASTCIHCRVSGSQRLW